VDPDEMLADPALEQRARALSKGLRCLVCRNESIDDSDAPLAHDLRVLLRDRLMAGDSDVQAVEYIVARYGEFVLYRPTASPHNLALWAGPAVLAATGGLILWRLTRRRQALASVSVQHEKDEAALNQRLDELLDESGGQKNQKRP
jgi:cytochrome c-type biogenesis protein CcmH